MEKFIVRDKHGDIYTESVIISKRVLRFWFRFSGSLALKSIK